MSINILGINHKSAPLDIREKLVFDKDDIPHALNDLKKIGGNVYGVDSSISISQFWDDLGGEFAVQGNLNPDLMSTTPEIVKEETLKILNEFGERNGLIFNLGHGIKPDGKIECMQALVETIINFNKDSHSTEPTLQQ